GRTLRPRVHLREFLAEDEAVEIGPPLLAVIDDLPADFVHADPLRPFVDALQIARLLAVHLDEGDDVLEGFVLRPDEAEHFRALDVEPRCPGEMDFVAGIDADHADILAGRLGAVPRAAGYGHLHLDRRPRAPHELLDADAETGRILRAEAA